MKFMGSKRWMLSNGLGEVIRDSLGSGGRFVDLFTGSGAVAIHVATNFNVKVCAADLQEFSVALARGVVERDSKIDGRRIYSSWMKRAACWIEKQAPAPDFNNLTEYKVRRARGWCGKSSSTLTAAYGGHYYSPVQAQWLDALRQTLPERRESRIVAIAALIETASKCAAAPGHTAQPFQPTSTAIKFLEDAWMRSVPYYLEASLKRFGTLHARQRGGAFVESCEKAAKTLMPGDVVFVDPPYSGVHYSRFYHVLENVATYTCVDVSGVGRYPERHFRPRSDFSMKGSSFNAMDSLLKEIKSREASAIVTFPDHECSNGLSGEIIRDIAKRYFYVTEKIVRSKFSTLGGNRVQGNVSGNRAARQVANELILRLK